MHFGSLDKINGIFIPKFEYPLWIHVLLSKAKKNYRKDSNCFPAKTSIFLQIAYFCLFDLVLYVPVRMGLPVLNQLYMLASINVSCSRGAEWLSGRVLDSRPRGRGFEPTQ